MCLHFAQADSGKLRIGKQTIWNLPARRYTVAAGEIGMNHSKVINADMRELRAASNLADCPDSRRGGLKALVDLDVSTVG